MPSHLCRALFIDTSGKYLSDFLPPELLSYYTVGSYYREGHLLKNFRPEGKTTDIIVEATTYNKIRPISSVINDSEYNLTHSDITEDGHRDFSDDNKKQLCVVFDNPERIIIFPCFVVGAAFYFLSTSMRQHVFARNLNRLCEAKHRINDEIVVIKLTLRARNEDAKRIARFTLDGYGVNRWNSISDYIRKEKRRGAGSHIAPKIDFPVRQVLHMKVRGLTIPATYNQKEKILVFDIISEDSEFSFNELEVIRDESESVDFDESSEVAVPTHTHRTSNRLVNKMSSINLAISRILNTLPDKNVNIKKIKVEYRSVQHPVGGGLPRVKEEGEDSVDLSVQEAICTGDEGTRHGDVVHLPKEDLEPSNKEYLAICILRLAPFP